MEGVYREVHPPPRLAPYVRRIWTSRDACASPGRVMPDGCIDVLFDRLDPSAARFVGTMTTALVLPGGAPVDVLGVRFEPGAARRFLDLPAREITDSEIPIATTWPAGRALADAIAVAKDPSAILIAALERRLAETDVEIDPAVAACVRTIERARGDVRNAELARLTGWSERQLERRFAAEVGIGPKRFARHARFSALLEVAADVRRGDWSRVAADLGYADQSHLIREIRALAGVTSRELIERARAG